MPNPENNPGGSTGEGGKKPGEIPRDVAGKLGHTATEATRRRMLEKLEAEQRELEEELGGLEKGLIPPIRPEGATSTGEKKPASKEIDKAKESKPLGRVLTRVVAGVLAAAALTVGGIAYFNNQNADTDETLPTDGPKANAGEEADAGETEAPAPSPADNYEPTSSNAGTPVEEESPEENLEEDNGEQEKNIAEISTYHGMYASEDGSTYNNEKRNKLNFGPSLKTGVSEDEMKDDLTGRLVQPAQLAATYNYMKDKTDDPSFGVEGADFDNDNDLIEAMEKNPDLHQKVYDFTCNFIRNNSMREDKVSGTFSNKLIDNDFETGDSDTSRSEVVAFSTEENNTPVYILESVGGGGGDGGDGGGGGNKVIYYIFKGPCGGQPIDEKKFLNLRQVTENPVTPEYTPTSPNINPDTPPGKPDTPPVTPPGKPDTPPVTPPAPKDYENTGRIDDKTLEDSSSNSGTGKTDVGQNKVDPDKVTPPATDYDGTTYEFVANGASETASTVDPGSFSPGTNYGSDRGGSNSGEYAPVKPTEQPKEPPIAVEDAPIRGEGLADGLSDLGIK